MNVYEQTLNADHDVSRDRKLRIFAADTGSSFRMLDALRGIDCLLLHTV